MFAGMSVGGVVDAVSVKTDSKHNRLGEFLRARREALHPADVGLSAVGFRRTPGLRRQEVADRAGVGLTWYTWLEQGRATATSGQVIDALARALLLDAEGHRHLRYLAGLSAPAGDEFDDARIESLHRVVERWHPQPAFVRTHEFDLIAWNQAFRHVYFDPTQLAGNQRNVVLHLFTDLDYRQRLADWEVIARAMLSHFRLEVARHPQNEKLAALVAELIRTSPEFRQWWPDHSDVHTYAGERHSITLGDGRTVSFDIVQLLTFDEAPIVLGLQMPVSSEDEAILNDYLSIRVDTLAR